MSIKNVDGVCVEVLRLKPLGGCFCMNVEDKRIRILIRKTLKTADCLKPERLSFSGLDLGIKSPFLIRVHIETTIQGR